MISEYLEYLEKIQTMFVYFDLPIEWELDGHNKVGGVAASPQASPCLLLSAGVQEFFLFLILSRTPTPFL